MPQVSLKTPEHQQHKPALRVVEHENGIKHCRPEVALENEKLTVHLGSNERLGLLKALVQDTVTVLPVKPDHVSNLQGPFLEVARVAGDGSSIDLNIMHRFRAHFQHRPQLAQLGSEAKSTISGLNIVELLESEEEKLSSVGLSTVGMDSATSIHQMDEAQAAVSRGQVGELSGEHSNGAEPSGSLESVVHLGADCIVECNEAEEPFTTDLAHLPNNGRTVAQRSQDAGVFRSSKAGSTPWELDPTQVLIGERLAVGGFAEVFFGKYQGTLVAIKVLVNVDSFVAERFRREVRLLAGLRHPNLILFMGYATRPHLAIVSEYMHRGSLFGLLRNGEDVPLEPRLQRTVAVGVARGMTYLHTREPPVLHMDLKSPNILIDDRWRVKVADFGLSRIRHHTFVSSGAGAGTPEWMAPEVLRSEQYNESADVYSYGVVLWEVLTGQQPWEGLHPMQVVGAVGFQGRTLPPPLHADPFLTQLCVRCMDPAPAERPSFQEIMQDLERQLAPSQSTSLSTSLSTMSLNSNTEQAGWGLGPPPALPRLMEAAAGAAAATEEEKQGKRGGDGAGRGCCAEGAAIAGGPGADCVGVAGAAADGAVMAHGAGQSVGGELHPPLPAPTPHSHSSSDGTAANRGRCVVEQQAGTAGCMSQQQRGSAAGEGRVVGRSSSSSVSSGSAFQGSAEELAYPDAQPRLSFSPDLAPEVAPHAEGQPCQSALLLQDASPFALYSRTGSSREILEEAPPPTSISHVSPFAQVQSNDLSDWSHKVSC